MDATAYKYRGSHISDLCLIYGNESQNGRSNCLDMKMEVNNNALWMGLTITWDMQYPAREFEISYQGKNKMFATSLASARSQKFQRSRESYKKHLGKGHE